MKVVIGSDHLGTHFIEELADTFPDVDFVPAYDLAEQPAAIADADVLFGWATPEGWAAAQNLKWIHCPGMGIDRMTAITELMESDVPITNAPGPHVTPMADWVLGTMLALAHNLRESMSDQRSRTWDVPKYAGKIVELSGRTMGIHGLGAIGRATARRAEAFGMRIVAVDPSPAEVPDCVEACWDADRLDDLARESDWLVVTAPIIPETRHVFDARRIGLMRPGSYVVVVSRGGIVDEGALADALSSGHLAGAALDATEVEPLPDESPLWDMDNVIITSHVSALSPELYEGRRQIFRDNLRRFIGGQPLQNLCDKQAGY